MLRLARNGLDIARQCSDRSTWFHRSFGEVGSDPDSGSGHNAAIFYSNVLHAMLTPALADRQIIAAVGDHMSPEQR